jgi:hypothetical protein
MRALGLAIAVIALLAIAAGAVYMVDVEETQEARIPDVNITTEGGQMPKYDARVGDVEVREEQAEVTVPDVDVNMEEQTVDVPTLNVTPPEETPGDTAETTINNGNRIE